MELIGLLYLAIAYFCHNEECGNWPLSESLLWPYTAYRKIKEKDNEDAGNH